MYNYTPTSIFCLCVIYCSPSAQGFGQSQSLLRVRACSLGHSPPEHCLPPARVIGLGMGTWSICHWWSMREFCWDFLLFVLELNYRDVISGITATILQSIDDEKYSSPEEMKLRDGEHKWLFLSLVVLPETCSPHWFFSCVSQYIFYLSQSGLDFSITTTQTNFTDITGSFRSTFFLMS